MGSPINILMVVYEPFPSGQTAHARSLVTGLDPARFRVRVILPDLLESERPAYEAAGARVTVAPIRKITWRPAAVSALAREIRSFKDCIVHIHSQEAGLIGRPLAKIFGARAIVYTPQTIDIRRKQFQGLIAGFERSLAGITDRIISVNAIDKHRLARWGVPENKIEIVYNSIDLSKFNQKDQPTGLRQSLSIGDASPVILQVGRLSAQKAPLNFVEGAAVVLKKHPNAKFVMIGEGPLAGEVKQRVTELGLDQHIMLLGACKDAYRLIAGADIVTLTSLWEGTPYSLLEAMGWAKPVVTTSVNGCPEIVSDSGSGLLVPPGDIQAWAEAVTRLLDHPGMAVDMGLEGRRRVEEKFSLPVMIRQMEAIYQDVGFKR